MVPALTTNTKSRFDIDLKAVYESIHISIATMKPRDGSVLTTGRGKHAQMATSCTLLQTQAIFSLYVGPQIVTLENPPPLTGPNLHDLPCLNQSAIGAGEGQTSLSGTPHPALFPSHWEGACHDSVAESKDTWANHFSSPCCNSPWPLGIACFFVALCFQCRQSKHTQVR